jgi:hypothetical protein
MVIISVVALLLMLMMYERNSIFMLPVTEEEVASLAEFERQTYSRL